MSVGSVYPYALPANSSMPTQPYRRVSPSALAATLPIITHRLVSCDAHTSLESSILSAITPIGLVWLAVQPDGMLKTARDNVFKTVPKTSMLTQHCWDVCCSAISRSQNMQTTRLICAYLCVQLDQTCLTTMVRDLFVFFTVLPGSGPATIIGVAYLNALIPQPTGQTIVREGVSHNVHLVCSRMPKMSRERAH